MEFGTLVRAIIVFSVVILLLVAGTPLIAKLKDSFLSLIAKEEKLTDEEYFEKAEIYEKQGNYEKAIEMYQNLIDNYPNSKLAPLAQYSIGMNYILIAESQINEIEPYQKVVASFQKVLSLYPNSDFTSKIREMEYIKLANEKIEQINKKATISQKIAQAEEITEANIIFYIALDYLNNYDYTNTIDQWNDILNNYPNSKSAVWIREYNYIEKTRELSSFVTPYVTAMQKVGLTSGWKEVVGFVGDQNQDKLIIKIKPTDKERGVEVKRVDKTFKYNVVGGLVGTPDWTLVTDYKAAAEQIISNAIIIRDYSSLKIKTFQNI